MRRATAACRGRSRDNFEEFDPASGMGETVLFNHFSRIRVFRPNAQIPNFNLATDEIARLMEVNH